MTRRHDEVSESELEASLAEAFGMDLASVRETANRRPMSEDEALDVSLREAFYGSAGGGPTAVELEEADRVHESATPASTEGHEGLDRRIDAAYQGLCTLAESRLGMVRGAAESHARKVFSDMERGSSSREVLARRLEYQVTSLQGLPPLASRGRS